ncbi:Rieske 2Fe-2S domain-containing protein [Spongiactinospora sp. TRM90649]|uniref:Rieske (2Fe-2S) protein n=1 Tax=Spongiactinospora sp. TRM90649 TaxID=3031114 RepID=UPI0023F9CE89|nr:Rieske 2Fe-2S domain-containing protein [Spongiactinospora sp. TRM90649]MDF5756931.1 Rieske 2Fe-2S domain-containing protein [Spongiactinospora sp. TRM90649]
MDSTAIKVHVGKAADFEDGDRRIVDVGGRRVGVFHVGGRFVAYLNICPHQGGPVCEGQYFPKVEAVLGEGGVLLGERSDRTEPHLVCPWHGWEYDLHTGVMVADANIKLRQYETVIQDGEVYVIG